MMGQKEIRPVMEEKWEVKKSQNLHGWWQVPRRPGAQS